MKNILLLSVFILATLQLFSQNNRYWVNGSGNWDDATHWSLSSGGDAGADIPTKSDNVFVDANSAIPNGDAIVINVPASVNNLNIKTSVVLKGKSPINIYGSANVSKSAVLKKYKGDIVFASSTKQKIDIPTKLNSNLMRYFRA